MHPAKFGKPSCTRALRSDARGLTPATPSLPPEPPYASFGSRPLLQMAFLFQHRTPEVPTVEPVRTVFPEIDGASMAAVFVGQRVAGDFYDAIRANPHRILFGLLDVAGRRGDTREILASAQHTFRTAGTELFAQSDINESEAMTELSHLLN